MPPPLDAQTRFDIEQYLDAGYEVSDIIEHTAVSQQQILKMRCNLRAYSSIIGPYLPQGRPRVLDKEMETTLIAWLNKKPLSYLFKIVYFLFNTFDGVEVSKKMVENIFHHYR